MPETVAITGATGFVGRHVALRLKQEGFHVRLLVRKPEAAMWLDGFEVIQGALEEPDSLKWLTGNAHVVIHCAGAIKARRGAEFERVNYQGTKSIAEAAKTAGVKRFIHLSSLAAREPALSDYAASKRRSEIALRETGIEDIATILRPPAIYGPGDRATLDLFRQMSRRYAIVPGTSRGRISLLYVEDLAEAITSLVTSDETICGVHEIADGRPSGYRWGDMTSIAGKAQGMTIRYLLLPRSLVFLGGIIAEAASALTGYPFMLSRGKARELYHEDWVCHGNLLEDVLDWTPKVQFEEGFPITLGWYRHENWL